MQARPRWISLRKPGACEDAAELALASARPAPEARWRLTLASSARDERHLARMPKGRSVISPRRARAQVRAPRHSGDLATASLHRWTIGQARFRRQAAAPVATNTVRRTARGLQRSRAALSKRTAQHQAIPSTGSEVALRAGSGALYGRRTGSAGWGPAIAAEGAGAELGGSEGGEAKGRHGCQPRHDRRRAKPLRRRHRVHHVQPEGKNQQSEVACEEAERGRHQLIWRRAARHSAPSIRAARGGGPRRPPAPPLMVPGTAAARGIHPPDRIPPSRASPEERGACLLRARGRSSSTPDIGAVPREGTHVDRERRQAARRKQS
jgi:hypothetical protein